MNIGSILKRVYNAVELSDVCYSYNLSGKGEKTVDGCFIKCCFIV